MRWRPRMARRLFIDAAQSERVPLSPNRTRLTHFFAELGRRKVVRVTIGYGIVGFAVIEATDILVEALRLPLMTLTVAAVVVLAGLPVALALAWAFDITPEGVKRTARYDPETPGANAGVRPMASARRLVGAAALAVLVVVTGSMAISRVREGVPTPGPPGTAYVDSVAVMPLDNLTGDSQYDHVGMGITEEIITHLAHIPALKVISRHSVQALSGQSMTAPQLASALGVRHIVEGSIRLAGDRLRTTVQHIDADTDAHLWAENFSGDVNDLIAVQEEIARAVVGRVVQAVPSIEAPDSLSHVAHGAGQQSHQLGKHWLGRRTPEGLNRSIGLFQQALAEDPTYAIAYADLSSAYALSLNYRYEVGIDGYPLAARSLAAADRAIELDPLLAAGYAARGYVSAIVGAPTELVSADFERAAEQQPNQASVASWSARVLARTGQFEEAIASAALASRLDPLASGRHVAVASLSLQLGRYAEALAAGRMASALEPDLVMGRSLQARAHLLAGFPERCLELDLGPHEVLRAHCLYEAGQTETALTIVDSVTTALNGGAAEGPSTFTDVLLVEDLACFYAWLGDADASLEWIRRAFALSPMGMEPRLLGSAFFEPVRGSDDFEDEVAEITERIFDRVRRESRQISLP